MGDGFWNRPVPNYASAVTIKRPRELDHNPVSPTGQDMVHYFPRDDAHIGLRVVKDTKSVGASFDRYLQNMQTPFASGEANNFAGPGPAKGIGGEMPSLGGGMCKLTIREPVMMGSTGAIVTDTIEDSQGISFSGQVCVDPMGSPGPEGPEIHLPPDASNTLFVEGLPRDSTERELAHIFHSFLGFKGVRLVCEEPKYRSGESIVLCFVDFTNAACAMMALNALQGYKMGKHEPDSPSLRLQFAQNPSLRSGPGSRGNG